MVYIRITVFKSGRFSQEVQAILMLAYYFRLVPTPATHINKKLPLNYRAGYPKHFHVKLEKVS